MTLLRPSDSNHTIPLWNTLPPTGGAGPTKKITGPHSTGGGGRGRGQTTPPKEAGESNKAKQDDYSLDRQGGGYHGVGGGRGVQQPCILYIYIYIYIVCMHACMHVRMYVDTNVGM